MRASEHSLHRRGCWPGLWSRIIWVDILICGPDKTSGPTCAIILGTQNVPSWRNPLRLSFQLCGVLSLGVISRQFAVAVVGPKHSGIYPALLRRIWSSYLHQILSPYRFLFKIRVRSLWRRQIGKIASSVERIYCDGQSVLACMRQ